MAQALSATGEQVEAWKDSVRAEIARLAALGVTFTSDDVSAVTGDAPNGSQGLMGAIFGAASTAGEIEWVSMQRSKRRSVHAKRVNVWRGKR